MRILLASAEVAPFARVGGLSDVVGALSKELASLGHEVSVFLPNYATIDAEKFGVEAVAGVGPLSIPMGDATEEVRLLRCEMPGGAGVRVFLLDHPPSFDREGIYVDPATGHGYPDETRRYALASRAILEAVPALGLEPDVLHLNDHHTALVLGYRRRLYADHPVLARAGAVFSIHNLGYQGRFRPDLLPKIGLDESLCRYGSVFEFNGVVNPMKIGIELADYVNTVSERYAVEISSTAEYGADLEGNLAARRKAGRLVGILNGVDYSVWDPSVDPLIPERYDADSLEGKARCRAALVERCGLSAIGEAPLVGMVSRLADQKGFDLVKEAAEDLLALGLGLVVLGTGQEEHHRFLESLAKKHAGRVSANLLFDNELAHWIEAGSDMFLMPSRYEPCGLNQMYSLRYGTVPVVRSTGGLVDTVEDYDPETGSGTGFRFDDYSADAMTEAVGRAVRLFGQPDRWTTVVRRGMGMDFGWAVSAGKYVELYETAARAARGS